MTIQSDGLDPIMKALNSKEGRKVIRNSGRVALETFNEETAENAKNLPLSPSGKKWRKKMARKGSYTYKSKNAGKSNFSFWSGVNYKKKELRITHLVEAGFQHPSGKQVTGHWFRKDAYRENRGRVVAQFKRLMLTGNDILLGSGKAPGLKTLRQFK